MNSLFLRLFVILTVTAVTSILLVHFTLGTDEEERAFRMLAGPAEHIALELSQIHPAERRDHGKELAQRFGYDVKFEPLREEHTRAEYRGAEIFVIAKIPDTEGQLVLGPLPMGRSARLLDALGWALLVSILLSAATTWPVLRRVRTLEALADRMRAGDFRARIRLEEGDVFDRVGQSLNSLADRIGQLLSDERDLLRTVAHEVRAPIARMRFRVDKLNRHAGEAKSQTTEGLVTDLAQVDNLFEELLTYVAFDEFDQEGPTLTTTSIVVREAVTRVVTEVTDVSEDIEVEVRGLDGCRIEANQKLFDRAVTNLLLNAMAYGGPKIVVEIRSKKDHCVVDIQDSGPGIPELDRQKVIKPFVRLHSKKKKGTGLGLAIVSRIMRLHGGHLYILDAPRGGASIQLVWRSRPPSPTRMKKLAGLVTRESM